jgi:RND family efflux transporter MFP subunit
MSRGRARVGSVVGGADGVVATAAAAVVLAMAAAACGVAEGEQPARPPAMPVEIAEVRAVPLQETADYVATLRSRRSVEVHPQADGYVTRIFARPGDLVEAGTVLMRIDPRRQAAAKRSQQALGQARRANVEYWRREHQRTANLEAEGAVTERDLEQVTNQLRSAEAEQAAQAAQVQQQAVELDFYDVLAPWQGVVGDIPVRVGDLVGPQALLTTVDDNDRLEIYVETAMGRGPAVVLGTPVEILDDAGKVLTRTRVTFVSPRASAGTQTLLVKALVDNQADKLRVAQLVRARLILATRTGPAVPVLAVQSQNGQNFAWVVQRAQGGPGAGAAPGGGEVAQPRPVEVGPIQGQLYPVLRGLKPGERVVVSGVQKLRPGAPVTPAPAGRRGGG